MSTNEDKFCRAAVAVLPESVSNNARQRTHRSKGSSKTPLVAAKLVRRYDKSAPLICVRSNLRPFHQVCFSIVLGSSYAVTRSKPVKRLIFDRVRLNVV